MLCVSFYHYSDLKYCNENSLAVAGIPICLASWNSVLRIYTGVSRTCYTFFFASKYCFIFIVCVANVRFGTFGHQMSNQMSRGHIGKWLWISRRWHVWPILVMGQPDNAYAC